MKKTSLRIGRLRPVWFAGLLVLALTACGGGSSSIGDVVAGGDNGAVTDPAAPSTDPAGTSTVLSSAAVDADIKNLLALSSDERQRRARALTTKVERDWLTLSGVEAELGGAAATDAAYANVAAQFAADQAALNRPASATLSGLVRPVQPLQVTKAGVEESAGGAIFMSVMEMSLLATHLLDQSKDAKPGESKSNSYEHALVVNSLEKLIYDSSYEHQSSAPSGLLAKLKTHFDIAACPDAQGVFVVNAKVETSMTKSGGATGQKSTLEVSVTGHVNDDAELVYSDVDTRMEMADFTNRKGAYVDFDLKYAIGTSPRPSSGTVNRTGGQMTDAFANDSYAMGKVMSMVIAIQLWQAAEKAWKSGRCVKLEPTAEPGPSGLAPGATSTITAAPRSKVDGLPTGGGVTATLIAGGASVSPSATRVPADARFNYVAPGETDQTGTVSVESRSRRGVGKGEITLDTKRPGAFQIVGGLDDFQVNQSVCDVTKPFSLSGGGFTALFSGGLTGTYTYTGPFNAVGGGTYAITLPEAPGKAGTMTGTGSGSVDTPLGKFSATGTERYTLTPLTACQ